MFISVFISEISDNSDGGSSSGPASGDTLPFLDLFLLFVSIRNRIHGQEEAVSTEAVTTTAISTGVRPCFFSLSFWVYVREVVSLHSEKEITLNRFSLCRFNLYNKEFTTLCPTVNFALLSYNTLLVRLFFKSTVFVFKALWLQPPHI